MSPTKGEHTRKTILDRAFAISIAEGLDALTIGRLADDLRMSKSGLFAHFRAKEALQVQVIQYAAGAFIDAVIRPALKAPRGLPRVRAVFDRWLLWAHETHGRGGCFFVGAATELDDRPGAARDELVQQQRDWLDFIAGAVRMAVEEGQLRPGTDAAQFAQDVLGIMLGYYHAARLLKDPLAEARARRAFDALIAAAVRVPRSTTPRRTGGRSSSRAARAARGSTLNR